MATAKKVMMIGLDAPLAHLVYNYAQQGHMPCMKRLLENGVYGANCLPPFPSITPPNWATLATGATSITHGLSCFNVHVPGDELDKVHQALDSGEVTAEFIWEAAERVGKKAIVINYPTSWPPRMRNGYQIGGTGLAPNEWCTRDVNQWGEGFKASLAYDQLWTTGFKMLSTDTDLKQARGWTNTPQATRMMEAELPLEYRKAKDKVKDVTWHALLVDTEGRGFDRVIVAEAKDAAAPLADLGVGQWSDTVVCEFSTAAGVKRAGFRLKLLELSPGGENFTLYRTSLCDLDVACFPDNLARELPIKGLPLPYPGYQSFKMRWFGLDTLNEIVEMSHEWLAEAGHYLLSNRDWSIYYMHVHTPDWAYHTYSNMADRATSVSEEEYEATHAADAFMYRSLDRLIDRIIQAVDLNETIVVLSSDHGAKATGGEFLPGQVLKDAGLVVFKSKDQDEVDVDEVEDEDPVVAPKGTKVGASGDLRAKFREFGEIDWSRTKAIVQRSCHVYVNLKGRDPQGIVDPKDYEKVRDQIISGLCNYTDPKTGKNPVVFALRREDARFLFMGGEGAGDVIYAVSGDFLGQHGGHLGTERYGDIGDLRSLFVMSGPGVKKGITIERTVWLQDIVPTICYLADLPVPEQCEGAIVYQALEDPNLKLMELENLKRRYNKMRKELDKSPVPC